MEMKALKLRTGAVFAMLGHNREEKVVLTFRPADPALPSRDQAPKDAIADSAFASLIGLLRDSRTHDEYRIHVLQNALLHRSVTAAQARELLAEVEFPQTKGAIAAILWRATRDREHFGHLVLDALDEHSRAAVIRVLASSGFGDLQMR